MVAMISVYFKLYRLVCDVTTFTGLFAEDSEGRHIPDTSAFICCWYRVPRRRTASTIEASGCSPAALFKAQGSDMTLSLNTAGQLELDVDNNVLAFKLRPTSHVGGSEPVVATGTLDPLPFVGKAAKNYAIKLRDVSGQVIGKLLFSLEAKELEENEKDEAPVMTHRRTDAASRSRSQNKPTSSPYQKLNVETQNNNNNNNGSTKDLYHKNGNDNVAQSGEVHDHRKEAISKSPPSADLTQRNSSEPVADSCGYTNKEPPAIEPVVPKTTTTTRESVYMELDIEKLIVKNESIDLENPAPLLLEGMYYLKIRYGAFTSCTPSVECRNPKEIKYFHQVKFLHVTEKNEKLRFSLWENNRQVAGFSLDPAKFRMPAGVWKEYSIPFRYYPTQQKVSLEVAARRVEETSVGNREQLHVEKEEKGNKEEKSAVFMVEKTVSKMESQKHLHTGSSSSKPHAAMEFNKEQSEENPRFFNTSSYSQKEKLAAASNHVSSTESEVYQRKNSAKDYVRKHYVDPSVRQSHWEAAESVRNGENVKQASTLSETSLPQPRPQQQSGGNLMEVTGCPPPRAASCDEPRDYCVAARESTYNEQVDRSRGLLDNASRMQTFLEQITNRNTRSSSATRRAAQSLELPRVSSSHRNNSARATENPRSARQDERDSTPLRHHSSYNSPGLVDGKGERGLSEGARESGYSRNKISWMRSSSQNGSCRGQRSEEASFNSPMNDRGRPMDSQPRRAETRPAGRTSLIDEWLEWRNKRASAQVSRTGSVNSAYSLDESVDSIVSRNRAVSPLPTKSFARTAEQRPYETHFTRRSASRISATPGRPPLPMR